MARRFKTGGRKKGSLNKITSLMKEAVAAAGETPLEYMLRVMRDRHQPPGRRDEMSVPASQTVLGRYGGRCRAHEKGKARSRANDHRRMGKAFWRWQEHSMSADADSTGHKQQIGRPFEPGESGNPAGRPKGSRNNSVRLSCKPSLTTSMPMAKRLSNGSVPSGLTTISRSAHR